MPHCVISGKAAVPKQHARKRTSPTAAMSQKRALEARVGKRNRVGRQRSIVYVHNVREMDLGLSSTRTIKESDNKRHRPRLRFPFTTFPSPKCPFVHTCKRRRALDREAALPPNSKQTFTKGDWRVPRLIAEVVDDRGILMDIRLVLAALPPHPCLWIDAHDGSSVNLAMSKHLSPGLELTSHACAHFERRSFATCSQTLGNARQQEGNAAMRMIRGDERAFDRGLPLRARRFGAGDVGFRALTRWSYREAYMRTFSEHHVSICHSQPFARSTVFTRPGPAVPGETSVRYTCDRTRRGVFLRGLA